MDIKKLIKSLLFVFVVVSLGVFVYKEFSPKNESKALDLTATKVDTVAVSGESKPAADIQPLEQSAAKRKEKALLPLTEVKAQNSRVIAYYFHGTFRCSTCSNIEEYSHEAIQKYFAKELGNGRLEFRHINVEEPDNKHFIQHYQLFTRSLVLSMETDGKEVKWKNLPDVWKLVRDKARFFQYVKDEVEQFLKETG
jgi:hypothetical protein